MAERGEPTSFNQAIKNDEAIFDRQEVSLNTESAPIEDDQRGIDLVREIRQIRGMPHEYLGSHQLLSAWFDRQQRERFGQNMDGSFGISENIEPIGKDIIDKKSAQDLADFLLGSRDNFQTDQIETIDQEGVKLLVQNIVEGRDINLHPSYIANIGFYLEKFQGKERHELIANIEKQVALMMQSHGDLSLSIAALLGEIEQHKVAYFVEDDLVDVLETKSSISGALLDQLAVLNRLNHPDGNVLLHKVIDFFQNQLETMQNYTPEQEAEKPWANANERRVVSTSRDFDEFVQEEISHSKNYLIKKHFQDYFETIYAFDEGKPGTVYGIAGGSSDETIYKFKHLQDSYNNRLSLGINEGWPIANAVLQIAPGYFGYYQGDRPIKLFYSPNLDADTVQVRTKGYCASNHSEDEYIYDELNDRVAESRTLEHASNKLRLLQVIWAFKNRLRDQGRSFFYDINRIEHPEELHPMVLGQLMTDNQEYIHNKEGEKNTIKPLKKEEYEALLFPHRETDSEKEYAYWYMMRLSMRKKIEDEFGVNLADMPLASQVQFLGFLLKKNIEEFGRVKQALASWPENKQDVAEAFFACAEKEEYGEVILSLAEQLKDHPGAAKKLFGSYVDFVEKLNDKVEGVLSVHRTIFPDASLSHVEIFAALSVRANEMLSKAAEQIATGSEGARNKETIVAELVEDLQDEIQSLEKSYQEFEKFGAVLSTRLKESSDSAPGGQLLKLRRAFEQKFLALLTREADSRLEKGFLANLEGEINALAPERLPSREPFYFPVGISKEMPQWQEVLAGRRQVGKPIDIYSYLFWLNNQGKKVTLMVCDEIQISNYQNLYDLTAENARAQALAIGSAERANYQAIIDTFALSNIEVASYQTFKEGLGHKMEFYRRLGERLSRHPVFKEIFLAMVQESVAGAPEGKEKFLPYALEELSWILATDGTKVSHRNEARYDVLAAFIKTVEILAKENHTDWKKLWDDPNPNDKFLPILNGAAQKLQNTLDARKTDAKKNLDQHGSEAVSYLDKAYETFKLIERGLKNFRGQNQSLPARFPKSFRAPFNFVAPSTSSQSFGWRGRESGKEEATVKFREPYSTYFYQAGNEIFLNSEQVVAAPEGLIAGKVLALDNKTQKEYAAKVIKPLLLQYFKGLEVAPASYFEQVGKTRPELLRECRQAKTIIDLLEFIQTYIVKPTISVEFHESEPEAVEQAA